MLIEFPYRYLVVSVVPFDGGPAEARLICGKCRERSHAKALAVYVAMQKETLRAQVWYLHGKGKSRELELIGEVTPHPSGTPVIAFKGLLSGEPDQVKGGPLILPERNPSAR